MKTITKRLSPNCNDRKDGKKPYLIIIHYTGTKTGEEAAKYYLNETVDEQAGPISPHYMIDENGHVTQFVEENKRAWHAGQSVWKGETDINSVSIGIELVNEGEYADYPPFPENQINALVALCSEIMQNNAIPVENILGHSDVAPHRKKDPGPSFPWARLRIDLHNAHDA